MKKKRIIGSLLAASIALTGTFAGCSLVSSNNKADMEQVISTVDISAVAEGLSEKDRDLIDNFATAVDKTDIIKRELIAYYLNVGYAYVQSGYYTASQVFSMLMDSLIQNAVLTQYATMYLLQDMANEDAGKSVSTVLAEYSAKATYAEKLEYVLGGKDSDEVKLAEYGLLSALNAAIDSYEKNILNGDHHDETTSSSTRTTPNGVDTEADDYYPKNADGSLNYNVYTGYTGYLLRDSGAYQDDALEDTTKATRVKAYNKFMSSIIANDLADPATEDLRDLRNLAYVVDEYETQLESRVINLYYDKYEKEQEKKLTDDGAFEYLDAVYNSLLDSQSNSNADAASFSTAMDNMSDSSFVLYSPDTEGEGTFGYVYNILLPYSAAQSAELSRYQSLYSDGNGGYKEAYYTLRNNNLLRNITTTDQRAPWFNGSTEYAFKASNDYDYYGKEAGREYLFFENNLTKNDRYNPLEKYDGRYSYNGYVFENEDDYTLIPNVLTIDDMLDELQSYVNYVLGKSATHYTVDSTYYEPFGESKSLYVDPDAADKDKEVDYSKFLYATGQVEFADSDAQYNRTYVLSNGKVKNNTTGKWEWTGEASEQYKALSAVNELQYAYTTDTGVLSRYLGYSVTLGDTTGYIKEFEYAAHEAIARGAGAFNVCAGDYGWHILYVTYTFGTTDGDNNPGGEEFKPNWSNIYIEGTFENLFYEWVKSTDISEVSTSRRTQIITQFNVEDETVVKYQDRYQDLLDL